MENFDEYLRQGEPNKAEKAKAWKTAIGLQQVDGLKPSDYLIATAKQNIEGDITIAEVKKHLDEYYQQHPILDDVNRTEEADKVSARIAEILSEKTFTFSPTEYLTIHRRLFQDIYSYAGKIRDYNITKKEWVLNGETVFYAGADGLKATLEYDFEQEKKFSYKGLSQQGYIEHIALFISYLWQIHVFGEGNTRTTAVFLIKYLRKLGFKEVNNDLFAMYSWYFRNALVRANYEDLSKGIHKTDKFLIRFLFNLLLHENHTLKNREMHVQYMPAATESSEKGSGKIEKSSEKIKGLIKHNTQITIKELAERLQVSTRAIEKNIAKLKSDGILQRIGADKGGYWKINIKKQRK
jgi:fido (protein-threonine AMPylation protein)/biotin operon repressor